MSIGAVIIGQGGKGSSGGGGGGTVTQGPAGLITAPWFVELSDGTNPLGSDANPIRIDPTGTTVQPENLALWGGAAVSAATSSSAAGTETAPVVRQISRKSCGNLETSTPLAANGVYTGASHDTLTTGDISISLSFLANVGGTSSGAKLQQSDDANTWLTLVSGTLSANTLLVIQGQVTCRYWRVLYTNGGTLQTSFAVYWTAMNEAADVGVTGQFSGTSGIITLPVALGTGLSLSDATNASAINSVQNSSTIVGVLPFVTTSGSSSTTVMQRAPNLFASAQATSSTSANTNVQIVAGVASQKIRLLKFKVQVTGLAAAASATDAAISIIDGTSTATGLVHYVTLPATALSLAEDFDSGWIDLGPVGYVSAAAANALSFQTSVKLTAGTINVIVAYCQAATV